MLNRPCPVAFVDDIGGLGLPAMFINRLRSISFSYE